MEKNPDDYSSAEFEEVKVEIKQVEALIKELQLSINGSITLFESLHVEVSTEHVMNRLSTENVLKLLLSVRSHQ